MTDHKVEELLWQEIDGELGPEERARLEFFLETEPVLRDERTRLEALSEALSRLENVEAPSELRRRIRRGVAAAERPRRVVSIWRPRATRRQYFALAAVLAAAVIGIAIFLGRGAPVEDSSLVGTALPGPPGEAAPPPPLESLPRLDGDGHLLEVPEAGARLRLRRDGALVRVTIMARGGGEIEVVFEQPEGSLSAPEVVGEPDLVRAEGGRIVVHIAAADEIELAIAPDPSAAATLAVRVLSEGRAVLESELEIGDLPLQKESTTNFSRIRR